MQLELRQLAAPDFGQPDELPIIPNRIYEDRCQKLYDTSNCDWVIVYGDKEHFGNIDYLSGYDPRFEESLLLLGPNQSRYLLVGNEGIDYSSLVKIKTEVVLCQTFSLMGQDRTVSQPLHHILKDIGIKKEHSVRLCGWKYLKKTEAVSGLSTFYVPAMIVESISHLIDQPVQDVTSFLMHPSRGLRAISEIEQIVALEWGATRASSAVMNIIKGTKPGMREFEAAAHMNYSGEPLSTHVMFASGQDKIIGLSGPSSRQVNKGDGATTAVGYWGGLSCRAGLIDQVVDSFAEKYAKPYYRAIANWYQTATIGVSGGSLFSTIAEVMAEAGMRSSLNPGHLTAMDEWVGTFVEPENKEVIQSGMAFQCDIIPTPLPDGITLNCEDSVVFADQELRTQLKERYPNVWERITLRQKFLREEIGLNIHDDLLPLSSNPAYYSPFWLESEKVLVVK